MQSNRTMGIIVMVVSLILVCCLCPLVADYASLSAGNGNIGALYAHVGGSPAIAVQLLCSFVLALVLLVVGIVMLLRREPTA
ncbi:MAG: hypothetical protein M1570_14820 [Chloroflexi bacterium]|nr:hypothetical protein [Chloroflexota bacterium]